MIQIISLVLLCLLSEVSGAGWYMSESERKAMIDAEAQQRRNIERKSLKASSIVPCEKSEIIESVGIVSNKYYHGFEGDITNNRYKLYLCSDGTISYGIIK